MKSSLITEYIKPIQIIKNNCVSNHENLLFENNFDQVYIGKQPYFEVNGKGYIILDFGKELQGGIRILTHRFNDCFGGRIRIRFGESVNETCSELGEKNSTNHHSLRDFETYLPHLADNEFGKTGFRFVRIDFLDDSNYKIVNIYASYKHTSNEVIGSFECDDKTINEIYEAAKRTIYLNVQDNLLEGIKRDRLVWIGDMQPEVLAYSYLFSDFSIIKKSIKDSLLCNPLPCWFGSIPTYSFWLIDILDNYLNSTGDSNFVNECLPYVNGVIKQLDLCVDEFGKIDLNNCDAIAREGFFFDWPTASSNDAYDGNRFIFVYCLQKYKLLCKKLGVNEIDIVNPLLDKLKRVNSFDYLTKKQVISIGYLSNMLGNEFTKEKLFDGGAHGLSTFFSYFILKSMSLTGNMDDTLNILKEYYGGMLSKGATTFWEDFDIDWIEGSGRIDELTPNNLKDIHGDFGAYCYKGFRHSLCHGWSAGPISFLIEKVIGFSINDNEVNVTPNLGFLKWAKASVPTRYGKVNIFIDNKDIKVDLPEGLKLK